MNEILLYVKCESSNEKDKALGFILSIVLLVSLPEYKMTLVKVLILFFKTETGIGHGITSW